MLKYSQPFYFHIAALINVGSWYICLETNMVFWDDIVRLIHEAPKDYTPNISKGISFFTPEFQEIAHKSLEACAKEGIPFDLEMQIITFNNRKLWIRSTAKPVIENNKIVGIKGVFQDIDETKKRELELQQSVLVIEAQNKQLLDFAHIVSHNLRSHSSNLEMVIDVLETVKNNSDREHILENLHDISRKLSETINNLNDVVTIKTALNDKLKPIDLEQHLLNVCGSIGEIIKRENATITHDFTIGKNIKHIPAYIDSILLNLLTNAIKYKHPKRHPIIHVFTTVVDNKLQLHVKDNGSGIDLDLHGNKLFGMYKTFHDHPDANGIGLFITKNQVEALGGNILIKSTPGIGSTFTIAF